jgi:hypothetical protein
LTEDSFRMRLLAQAGIPSRGYGFRARAPRAPGMTSLVRNLLDSLVSRAPVR